MTDSDTSSGPATYRHDPAQVPVLAQLVDHACEGIEDLHEASSRVKALAQGTSPALDPVTIGLLKDLFCYMLSPTKPGSAQPGATLGPLDGPSWWPLALRDADSEISALWLALAETVTHPIARARCYDIVFCLTLVTNRRDSADHAARAYLAAMGGSLRPRDQSLGLLRAWDLARSVGLHDREAEIAATMLDTAEAVITRADDPHAALPLLEAVTAPRRGKDKHPDDLRAQALLDQALVTYTTPHILTDIANLIRARAAGDAARVEHASRTEVAAWLAEVDSVSDGLRMRYRLNEVASLAHKLGVFDLEREAVSRLQAAPPVEWATFTSEVQSLPEVAVHIFMHPFRHAEDWRVALYCWFLTEAPSGNLRTNEIEARRLSEGSVLRRLMTQVHMSDRDMPKRVTVGDEAALAADLIRVETNNITVHGFLLASALDIIAARFSIPSQAELASAITDMGTSAALAEALATGLRLYWAREYSAAAHLTAVKVEAAARALLLELNEPVYRTAIGDGVGQFASLGALLAYLLDNEFDPNWERFLRTYLLNDGSNVRNLIAHGFLDEADRSTAALSLRGFSVLALITSDDAVQRDKTLVTAALAHPVKLPPRPWWRRIGNAARAAYVELRRR